MISKNRIKPIPEGQTVRIEESLLWARFTIGKRDLEGLQTLKQLIDTRITQLTSETRKEIEK